MKVHHDDPLLEEIARTLCHRSGGNCLYGVKCGRPSRCRPEGWLTYLSYAETAVRVIKRQHLIQPKQRAAASLRAIAASPDTQESA